MSSDKQDTKLETEFKIPKNVAGYIKSLVDAAFQAYKVPVLSMYALNTQTANTAKTTDSVIIQGSPVNGNDFADLINAIDNDLTLIEDKLPLIDKQVKNNTKAIGEINGTLDELDKDLTETDKKIGTLNDVLTELDKGYETTLGKINDDISNVTKRISDNETAIKNINDTLDEFSTQYQETVNGIKQDISNNTTTLNTINEELPTMKKTVQDSNALVTSINNELPTIKQGILDNTTTLNTINGEIGKINAYNTSQDVDIKGLLDMINALTTRVDELEKRPIPDTSQSNV